MRYRPLAGPCIADGPISDAIGASVAGVVVALVAWAVFVYIAVHGTKTEIPDPSFATLAAGGTIELLTRSTRAWRVVVGIGTVASAPPVAFTA